MLMLHLRAYSQMHIATNIMQKAFMTGTMDLVSASTICFTALIRPNSLPNEWQPQVQI
jgi:hypothetical protein